MVRDIGGASYPLLTCTNYSDWVVVMLKARGLWQGKPLPRAPKTSRTGGHP
uniref:Uncharacterized protein n=1 Tax=Arundo donax TaxID=35708 RepID=A0A0A9A096_ARUDO